jgi:hypothetical protein
MNKKQTNFRTLLILALVVLLSSNQNIAQNVGIGAESFIPDASAGLEIQFNNKGLLIPQIALTGENDALTIPLPATSLLVYNTTVGSGLVAGYYYNAGTPQAPSWKRLTTTNDIVVADGSETKVTAGTNVTITGIGTVGNPYVVNASGGGSSRYIGEQYGGGVIFHLWKDNAGVEHGLIVATTDQSTSSTWSNITNVLIGAAAQSSWDGLSNSNAIVAQAGHTSSAAKLCLDLVSGGQSDWYLPSIDELSLLWHNRFNVNKTLSTISGATVLATGGWWSSTEISAFAAWAFTFYIGDASANFGKTVTRSVRAVRSF